MSGPELPIFTLVLKFDKSHTFWIGRKNVFNLKQKKRYTIVCPIKEIKAK
jgi:hypothetical protein